MSTDAMARLESGDAPRGSPRRQGGGRGRRRIDVLHRWRSSQRGRGRGARGRCARARLRVGEGRRSGRGRRVKVAGFTSTGSKRPEALFGTAGDDVPLRMVRSSGCWVLDAQGREYLDFVMALGAVALGYADPEVNRAVWEAVERGTIGSLSPVEEAQLAAQLGNADPDARGSAFPQVRGRSSRGCGTGGEYPSGRDRVLGCGYHGWLDWCSRQSGVPNAVQALFDTIPFNDAEKSIARIREQGDALACVVIEPVVEAAPAEEWLEALREATEQVGAVLIFDEIKTAFRVAHGGAVERWGGSPDLIVLGKAMANGYPLAAFGGRVDLMARVSDTWISSTMATEFVSLAAARATIAGRRQVDLPIRLGERGEVLFMELEGLAASFPIESRRARRHSGDVLPRVCVPSRPRSTWQSGAPGVACCSSEARTTSCRWSHDAGAVDQPCHAGHSGAAGRPVDRYAPRARLMLDRRPCPPLPSRRRPAPTGPSAMPAAWRAGEQIGITCHVASILGSWGRTSPTYFPSPEDVSAGNDPLIELHAASIAVKIRGYVCVNPELHRARPASKSTAAGSRE